MYLTTGLDKAAGCKLNASEKNRCIQGFPQAVCTWGDKCRGTKHLWGGGLTRRDIDLMGGGSNFDRLYHKLHVKDGF